MSGITIFCHCDNRNGCDLCATCGLPINAESDELRRQFRAEIVAAENKWDADAFEICQREKAGELVGMQALKTHLKIQERSKKEKCQAWKRFEAKYLAIGEKKITQPSLFSMPAQPQYETAAMFGDD